MRGTLSHPTLASGCLLIVLMSALACDGRNAGGASATPGATAKTDPETKVADEPFVWPDDPSHPVLEVSVEASDQQGTILIELMPELAPGTVVNVIELADEGYYDGTTFHRVIPGFMIQGGDPKSRDRDPTNDGTGEPGRPLQDEFSRAPFLRGVVGMGNKGRENSTSTQFFIMHADNQNLDGRYSAVGRVIQGMEFVDALTDVKIDKSGRWGAKDRPIENIVMKSVRSIGQVAEVRAALEGKAAATELADAANSAGGSAMAADGDAANGGGPPAAIADNDDWERLEAGGR